ncbi:adenosylcobyric acid synthase (glutamine-hydrolysing) [Malonomonas rubra DSM 5091]|uniref:Cobyric acid synthase n=1 Tax=Malonomonas rubra DSM 5091 TaxID=1122189 RepID=A0A1M6GMD7_MALRU|nr:cobyric acid synthase [Malonomonas rubra]SHJ11109.1 adenosylcobyric acid synthase (glutamine-hydrolysing) [Malonomonas rubra DSM 5091]
MTGKLWVVGLGPGDVLHLTPAARAAIEQADCVAGYKTYLELIPELIADKELLSSGMRQEVERCKLALERAESGSKVALVCSGDAGVYGMAGLVLELLDGRELDVEMVPGVSAVQAAAARLGAPLMHDFSVISLSDLLTPWPLIRQRLTAAGSADFVVALYNPKSKGRTTQIGEARDILLRYRSAETPVGIVRNACRAGEEVTVTTLGRMLDCEIDMFSLVLIGNSSTYVDATGRMVTPRGYAGKYFARQDDAAEGQKPKALFVGGTGSDVGKSVINAGLCRIFARRGWVVAPFKAQNMALNSAVTPDGGEIGRAQALQAAACGLEPHIDMNPVLLKPNSDTGSQVIIHGRPVGNMSVRQYHDFKPEAFQKVTESYRRLAAQVDLVMLEGAGSIAEINLMAHDITNLKAAALAEAPVILVADIDRGGVFAAVVGTVELLSTAERAQLKGIIINKFRGEASLLKSGIEAIEDRTGLPVLGVVPVGDFKLPEEDSVALERKAKEKKTGIQIGVVRLPRISNYTDFDPLEQEPDVALSYIEKPEQLDGLQLLIIPGTKSTLADLEFLEESGLASAIRSYHAAGGRVIGICGGFQILGNRLTDPDGVESERAEAAGLGLLDVDTVLKPGKQTHQVTAEFQQAAYAAGFGGMGEVTGYEIHAGESECGIMSRPLLRLTSRSGEAISLNDGAVSADGRAWGTYLHGFFDNDRVRYAVLAPLRAGRGDAPAVHSTQQSLNVELDKLADHLEKHLDIEQIASWLRQPESRG